MTPTELRLIFLCLFIKVSNFAFDKNTDLLPKTNYLGRCTAGVLENIAISGRIYFWYLLIIINNFAFDEEAVLWPETTCLDGWWVGGWIF